MSDIDREDLASLAPWYAAGLLSPEEMARLEAALAADPALRANLEAARAELEIVREDVAHAGAPSPQTWDRIAAAVAANPRKAGLFDRLRAICAALVERAAAAPVLAASLAAAAAVVLVVESGALLRRAAAPTGGFQTASDPRAQTKGAELLIVFAPAATVARVSAILAAQGATMVDGPRAGGLYRIALPASATAPEDVAKAIAALRAEDGVASVLPAPAR